LEGLYSRTYWCYYFKAGNDSDLVGAINQLLKKIDPYRSFLQSVKKSGGNAEIAVCIISSSDFGESFDSEVLLSLGKLGIGLSFDIYFGEPDKPGYPSVQS
jgi:hypothetical protein